jgi:hypothetical protein
MFYCGSFFYLVLVGCFQLIVDEDPGLVGNLLVERLLGAHIDLVSKGEFTRIGSVVCFLHYVLCCWTFEFFSYCGGVL